MAKEEKEKTFEENLENLEKIVKRFGKWKYSFR